MTMQGVNGWIGPFDIAFAAYCCRIFVLASFVFYITLSATECSLTFQT